MTWASAERLLAVRLDTIGDVLMTGPALRALKHTNARVTLLTSRSGALVADLMPEVDETIVYDAPWMKPTDDGADDPGPDLELTAELRARAFDAAAIFTVYTQSPLPAALLCHLGGVPLRLAHCRENPYGLLTDWIPEPEPEDKVRHEVQRQLALVAHVGARTHDERLHITVPERARATAAQLLAEAGERWVAVHPGSTAESRRYPPEAWAAACAALRAEHGVELVFTGDAEEAALVERIRAESGGTSLAGRLDLPELAAVLEAAPLLLAGNTGPVHVAAAVGTPVVDLYALTNPQHAPWGVPARVLYHDVPCRWCYRSICVEGHHHCLRKVQPADVVEAALALLAGDPAPPVSLPPVPARTPRPRRPGRRSPGS